MSKQANITIVLLNYRRPQNIPVIVDAIRAQTVRAQVFLWNNGGAEVNSPRIDLYRRSEKNVGCMARWALAKEANTPYVMCLDDDICFKRSDALAGIVQALEAQDHPGRIIGFIGACFSSLPVYNIRREIMCRYDDEQHRLRKAFEMQQEAGTVETVSVTCRHIERDEAVDLVKGRMMAFRKSCIEDLVLPEEREDDIFLSASLAKGQRQFHRIPMRLNDAFYELPEHGVANWTQAGHINSRDRALKAYFTPRP